MTCLTPRDKIWKKASKELDSQRWQVRPFSLVAKKDESWDMHDL